MHVFLYEWITGGGLVDESGRLPSSLLAEGSAMISALAADFLKSEGCEVTVLRDLRLTELPLPRCNVIDIHSAPHGAEEFDRAVVAADWTLVVAPEFDGILRQRVAQVRAVGGRSLNASYEFIALASDKHETAARWQDAGVPVPPGRLIAADDPKLPADFQYPAVLKPIDGAGSQHTLLVHGHTDEPPPYPWQRRLEEYRPGRAASVAFICGEAMRQSLPPCWQNQSTDGRFTYRGGSLVREPVLAERATSLALRALDALPPALGYVGVDLVLGDAPDGSDDVAIEVNPRLTTSYVGLRAVMKQNLAQAMLIAAAGDYMQLSAADFGVEFSADGGVWMKP
jgi:predicted ATP-grasp superfamily ATP-dependent carboligase